ncbi:MAG: hypothetical protein WD696_07880 [Bryobacteraceae bacterium]
MSVSAKGGEPVTRARIGSLKLRVAAGDARSAKALAMAVASRLALRVDGLGALAGRETVRARVTARPSMSREAMADSIADEIANPLVRGRR